jgi:hypothetical protein
MFAAAGSLPLRTMRRVLADADTAVPIHQAGSGSACRRIICLARFRSAEPLGSTEAAAFTRLRGSAANPVRLLLLVRLGSAGPVLAYGRNAHLAAALPRAR